MCIFVDRQTVKLTDQLTEQPIEQLVTTKNPEYDDDIRVYVRLKSEKSRKNVIHYKTQKASFFFICTNLWYVSMVWQPQPIQK